MRALQLTYRRVSLQVSTQHLCVLLFALLSTCLSAGCCIFFSEVLTIDGDEEQHVVHCDETKSASVCEELGMRLDC